jgi:hypothetical protein
MPAGVRADGGGVVVKSFSVMGKAGRSPPGEIQTNKGSISEPGNADDGRRNGALFSGIAGDTTIGADFMKEGGGKKQDIAHL